MKRWVLTGLILVLVLGLPSWGCYYLFWTPEGVRWVFKAVSYFSPLTLSAEKVEGRIAGPLYLEGVKAVWTDGHMQVQKLQARLKPFHLLRGKIVFEEIRIFGIILDDQKKRTEPLDLSLPKVGGFLARVGMEVRSFSLKEISYRGLGDRPRIIKTMAGHLVWRQGMLGINHLLLDGDLGRFEGTLGVGFSVPAIGVDIHWAPAKPWQGLDQILIQGQLSPTRKGEHLAGPISIKGRTGTSDRILFQADLGITPHRINLRKVSFRERGRKGSISGQGAVFFDRAGPAFQTLLTLEDVDLSRESSTAIRLSGQLRFAGRPDEYTGTFDLNNKVRSWQAFRLAGTLQGKQAGLEVSVAQGEWLKGSLQGRLGITLDEEISIHGFLQGRQLRPEVIHPHWSGLINLDAQGVFFRSLSGVNRGNLAVNLLESRFQEKNLYGEMKARLEKNALFIERAEFRGRGFRFSGRGVLSERLDFETQVSDLSSLVPNSRGSISAAGWVRANFFKNNRLDLQASADLTGVFRTADRRVELTRGGLRLAWDEFGLRSSWNLETNDGGRVRGEVTSPEKGRFAYPDRGKLAATGEGIDLDLFYPGKISGLQARGKIMGRVQGEWTTGPRFTLKGRLEIAKGSLTWQEKGAAINSLIKKADVGILWTEDSLRGDLILELDDYGRISGDFKLPLPIRIPVKIKSDGPFELNLTGKVRERGLLTALFPEAVQTSRGRIHGNLSAKGTWEKPILEGELELSEAGADLLPLGIQVRNVSAKATFNQDRINLSSLEMQSGPGLLNGRAIFWLKDRKIARLEGKLTGNHFQFINRPGVEAQASPNLNISGTPDHLTLDGVLEIPEALLSRGQPGGFKRASPDVIIVDPSISSQPGTAWPIQGEIRLLLGQQVRLKAEGLDAFLQGGLSVGLKGTKSIKAHGEIQVARGHYLLQNQKLEIARGRFLFNGPPGNPALDLLALRSIRGHQRLEEWVEEVKAGIAVTGTLHSPLVKLYSRPPLSETDILSYILFGEPLKQGAGKQDLALLSKTAGILLGGNFQGKLAGLFKLDTMEIQSGNGDFSRSVITVGKYLDPRLFLGLGGSLFDNSYQVILRYALTPHLEIETKGGSHSSGGIFFKIDFE